MKFNVITLFPKSFMVNNMLVGPLSVGIIGKAFNNQWFLNLDDLKEYSDHLCRLDERPVSGGPGMIFRPDKLSKVLDKYSHSTIYFLSPRGIPLNQNICKKLSLEGEITLLSGRYETIDQRLIDHYNLQEISIGDYVLCGGELPIQVIMESVIRLLPGVMNNENSGHEESFSNVLLEHDQFTKPLLWNNLKVPEILLTGNHKKISEWQWKNSIEVTYSKRKDLYEKFTIEILKMFIIRYICKVSRVLRFMKCL